MLALERFAHAFVVAHAQMLDARARRGFVREVHGDLRAEHVLLDESCRSSTASSSTVGCARSTWPTISRSW